MWEYSLDPAEYMSPEQLEHVRRHVVMSDDQLRRLQDQIEFLRDYTLCSTGGSFPLGKQEDDVDNTPQAPPATKLRRTSQGTKTATKSDSTPTIRVRRVRQEAIKTEEPLQRPLRPKRIKQDPLAFRKLRKVKYDWLTEACGVCGNPAWEEKNEMVYCDGDGCDFICHLGCYGLDNVPDEDPWYCDACSAGLDPLQSNCLLCPVTGGVLRKVTDLGNCILSEKQKKKPYVHISCALWSKCLVIEDPIHLRGITLSGLSKPICDRQCGICLQQGNACTECSYKGCTKTYHILCARHSDYKTAMKHEGGTISFCDVHSFQKTFDKSVQRMMRDAVEAADPEDVLLAQGLTVEEAQQKLKNILLCEK